MPKQNRADSGKFKIKVDPTQVRQVMVLHVHILSNRGLDYSQVVK